jgi:hypothetical protein
MHEGSRPEAPGVSYVPTWEGSLASRGSEECPTPDEMQRDGFLSSRSKTEDPWGTPYRIQCEPDYAIAISAGRDGIFDTGDDIKSDEPQ